MISVNVSGETAEDVVRQMHAFLAPVSSASEKPASAKAEKESKKAKAEMTKEEPPATTNGPITFAQVSEIIPKLVAAAGRPKAIEILGRYGATKGGELKPDQYAEFIASAKTEITIAEKSKASA